MRAASAIFLALSTAGFFLQLQRQLMRLNTEEAE
jgi:hypothetical protein